MAYWMPMNVGVLITAQLEECSCDSGDDEFICFLLGLLHFCITHTIYVWYIYLHLVKFYGKCR